MKRMDEITTGEQAIEWLCLFYNWHVVSSGNGWYDVYFHDEWLKRVCVSALIYYVQTAQYAQYAYELREALIRAAGEDVYNEVWEMCNAE